MLVAFVSFAVCVIYVALNPPLTGTIAPEVSQGIPFEDGWTTPDGTPATLSDIDELPNFAERGATIQRHLPSHIELGTGICFLSSNATLHVSYEGTQAYAFDPPRASYEMPYATQLNFSPLSPEDAGGLVTLDVQPVYAGETVSISNVCIHKCDDYIQSYIRTHSIYYAESIVVCFMGILIVLLHIALRSIKHGTLDLLSLGITFILVGMWSGAVTLVTQFATGLAPYVSALEYLSLLFVPFPIVYFTTTLLQPRHRTSFIGLAGVVAILAVGSSMFLALTQRLDLHRLLPISHAQLILCVVSVIGQAVSVLSSTEGHKLRKSLASHNMLVLAFIIFMACGVMDFVRFLAPSFLPGDTALFMRHGIFLFSICVAITAAQTSLSYISRAQYADKIELIAYTDALTQLGNRAAWKVMQEEMDTALAQGTVSDIAVCQFDVNFLKKVNDEQGHAAGDLRIKHSAETIKRSYGIEGTCYRTGGDEFTAIVAGDSLDERIKECQGLFEVSLCEQESANESGVPLSLAVGVARASETEERNVRAAQKLADARMYENKRAMKAGRRD